MRNTLTIECLNQAMENLMHAKQEHDTAREAYIASGGYSWGYYGWPYVQAMEKAVADLQERLDAYIDARIEAKLERLAEKGIEV